MDPPGSPRTPGVQQVLKCFVDQSLHEFPAQQRGDTPAWLQLSQPLSSSAELRAGPTPQTQILTQILTHPAFLLTPGTATTTRVLLQQGPSAPAPCTE